MKLATIGTFVLALTVYGSAQTPSPAAPQGPDPLPVRRVVLYKSGVGYFEHLGRIRGNQTVTIDFTSGQLDDVLKSLTALDLDGGRVSGVSYNSEAGLDRRLGALRLPVGQQTTRTQFLSALRGARLEVRSGATKVTGRLLSVERVERRSDGVVSAADALSIVTDTGELQTIVLDPGVSVRIAEADLNEEVGKYLALVASVRDQDLRRLAISTAGTGDRDLFVSYVSEVPVWKATYRLVLPAASEKRQPLLQGWAIIDNTVGEDWENVQLSLVAGAPQSFVQQISRPYYVQRPVVPLPQRVSLSPQTHQGAIVASGFGVMTGTVTDRSGGIIPGATVVVNRGNARVSSAITDRTGRYRLPGLDPGQYQLVFTLSGFKTLTYSGVNVTGGMETVLNATMEVGSLSETVTVSSSVSTTGRGSTVSGLPQNEVNISTDGVNPTRNSLNFVTMTPRLDATEEVSVARAAQQVDAAAAQLGDLFEYKLKEPVTIRKNQSALVPILNSEVTAERVSLWNAATGSTRALRAVWLTNATGLTLDGGSFSVIDGQAFAGEGIVEPLKAGEKRLLSYALDLALTIDSKGDALPSQIKKIQVSRGVMIVQTEERVRRTYSARNDDSEPRTLVIEHPARGGWSIGGTLKPAESSVAWHRFRVTVEPRTTATFTVEETRPLETQVEVSSVTDEQLTLLVREKALSPALEAALREVMTRKAAIGRLSDQINLREEEVERIGADQQRVRENMRSLKGSSEERQLIQRYVKQLDEQETRIEAVRREITSLTAERAKAQTALEAFIEGITM
jgi:hypothetical protein